MKWAEFEYYYYTSFYIPIYNIGNFLFNNLTLILSQKRQTLCMRKHYNSKKKTIFIGIYYMKIVAVYGGRRESNHVKLKKVEKFKNNLVSHHVVFVYSL